MFNQDKCSGSRRYHKACHKCRSCGKLLAPGKAHLHNKEPYCRSVSGKHLHFWAQLVLRKHVPIFIASEKTNTIELKPMLQDLPCINYPATNTIDQIEQMLQDLLYSIHPSTNKLNNWTNWQIVAGLAMHQLPNPPHLRSSLTRPPSSKCALWTFWTFGTNWNVFSILNIFNMRIFGTFRIFWTSRAPWTSWSFRNSVESCCGQLF